MIQDLNRKIVGRLGKTGTIVVGSILSLLFLAAGGPLVLAGAGMSLVGVTTFALVLVGPALWVLADARKRGMAQPFLWGLFALIGNVLGAIVYILVRGERRTSRPCATCGQPVASDHAACPYCGTLAQSSRRTCQRCHNELEFEWRFCPYCRTEVGSASTAA